MYFRLLLVKIRVSNGHITPFILIWRGMKLEERRSWRTKRQKKKDEKYSLGTNLDRTASNLVKLAPICENF